MTSGVERFLVLERSERCDSSLSRIGELPVTPSIGWYGSRAESRFSMVRSLVRHKML